MTLYLSLFFCFLLLSALISNSILIFENSKRDLHNPLLSPSPQNSPPPRFIVGLLQVAAITCTPVTLTVQVFDIATVTLTDIGWFSVDTARVFSTVVGGVAETFVDVDGTLYTWPASITYTTGQRVTVQRPHPTATLVLTTGSPSICLVATYRQK